MNREDLGTELIRIGTAMRLGADPSLTNFQQILLAATIKGRGYNAPYITDARVESERTAMGMRTRLCIEIDTRGHPLDSPFRMFHP